MIISFTWTPWKKWHKISLQGYTRLVLHKYNTTANSEKHTMLRTLGKTLGGTLTLLCLASTLAIAQGESRTMTCMQVNGKGVCTAAAGQDGKEIVVIGEDLKVGALMTCVDRGNVVSCREYAGR